MACSGCRGLNWWWGASVDRHEEGGSWFVASDRAWLLSTSPRWCLYPTHCTKKHTRRHITMKKVFDVVLCNIPLLRASTSLRCVWTNSLSSLSSFIVFAVFCDREVWGYGPCGISPAPIDSWHGVVMCSFGGSRIDEQPMQSGRLCFLKENERWENVRL